LGTRFRTADREEKGVGTGNTWWALFASEEIGEGLGTWRRAAASVAHPVVADRGRGGERAHGGWHWEGRRRGLWRFRVSSQIYIVTGPLMGLLLPS